jgi:hypothetical protein
VIWKWELEVTDRQVIDMPVATQFLTVQVQRGALCLWGIVTPGEDVEPRMIRVYGTGNPIPVDPGRYIGTAQQGPFVWHVFEGDETITRG